MTSFSSSLPFLRHVSTPPARLVASLVFFPHLVRRSSPPPSRRRFCLRFGKKWKSWIRIQEGLSWLAELEAMTINRTGTALVE